MNNKNHPHLNKDFVEDAETEFDETAGRTELEVLLIREELLTGALSKAWYQLSIESITKELTKVRKKITELI